mmetsp:Transcript_39833/g.119815  ORF Transcript_39833/g.119815 Transcript_39833/m.119815 type:complete len:236 (+) Transcript_39833:709-1416(+)
MGNANGLAARDLGSKLSPVRLRSLSMQTFAGSSSTIPSPVSAPSASLIDVGAEVNMLFTDVTPCNTPVLARNGRPSTSPAPYTFPFFAVVCKAEFTVKSPYSSTSMPAEARLRFDVLGLRPTAARYALHFTSIAHPVGRPPPPRASRVILIGALRLSSGTSNDLACAPRSILMPDRTKSATSVAAISLSKPIFIRALRGTLSLIIRVTSAPKLRKILANSMAIMPLPVIAMDLGK